MSSGIRLIQVPRGSLYRERNISTAVKKRQSKNKRLTCSFMLCWTVLNDSDSHSHTVCYNEWRVCINYYASAAWFSIVDTSKKQIFNIVKIDYINKILIINPTRYINLTLDMSVLTVLNWLGSFIFSLIYYIVYNIIYVLYIYIIILYILYYNRIVINLKLIAMYKIDNNKLHIIYSHEVPSLDSFFLKMIVPETFLPHIMRNVLINIVYLKKVNIYIYHIQIFQTELLLHS